MLKKIITISLFFVCFSLHASEGISQAQNYQKNSAVQWDLAMGAMEGFTFNPNDAVLDVGCGDGKITAWIAEKTPDGIAVGIDISKKMISQAAEEFSRKNLFFLQANAETIPFKERFDKLVSFNTLHWVLQQKQALESMKASLKPGGKLLLIVPVKAPNVIGILGEKLVSLPKWSPYFPSFRKQRAYYTSEEYTELLKEAGFTIESFTVFQGMALYKDRQAFVDWVRPLVNFIDHLSVDKKEQFIEEMVDEILLIDPPLADGSLAIRYEMMQIRASKQEISCTPEENRQ